MKNNNLAYAAIAGCAAVMLHYAHHALTGEDEGEANPTQSKEQTMKQVLAELKRELTKFKIDPPHGEDGLLTKDFMIKMHILLYKFKKYGQDMLGEANFHQRVYLMRQAEEYKAQGNQAESDAEMKKYDALLRGEREENDLFVQDLQETVFDYFNLIVKEYYMAIEKWGRDMEYVEAIKKKYEEIDKEIEEDEKQVEVPEGLTKEVAEQLLREKEELLIKIYEQLNQMQQVASAGNFDFETTVLLNRTMFDDKMMIKTGFSGKDL